MHTIQNVNKQSKMLFWQFFLYKNIIISYKKTILLLFDVKLFLSLFLYFMHCLYNWFIEVFVCFIYHEILFYIIWIFISYFNFCFYFIFCITMHCLFNIISFITKSNVLWNIFLCYPKWISAELFKREISFCGYTRVCKG
jgi:hypothetical protein